MAEYYEYDIEYRRDFSVLIGKTLVSVENKNNEELIFTTSEGEKYRQVYYQDYGASCRIEDICGDLNDLIGTPILMAEESSSKEPSLEILAERELIKASDELYYFSESETWTFYKIATIKGSVTIRWYGESNGYYSEEVTFEKVKND